MSRNAKCRCRCPFGTGSWTNRHRHPVHLRCRVSLTGTGISGAGWVWPAPAPTPAPSNPHRHRHLFILGAESAPALLAPNRHRHFGVWSPPATISVTPICWACAVFFLPFSITHYSWRSRSYLFWFDMNFAHHPYGLSTYPIVVLQSWYRFNFYSAHLRNIWVGSCKLSTRRKQSTIEWLLHNSFAS